MALPLRVLALSALFTTLSCAARAPSWSAVAIEAPAHAAAMPAPAARTYLVWTRREGGPVTRLVSVGPGGPREIGEADGAIVVWDHHAYRFTTEESDVDLVGCDASTGAPTGPTEKGRHVVPALEDLASHDRVALDDAPSPTDVNEIEEGASIEASLGPYVFATSTTFVYACGAHGNSAAEALVWDLRVGKRATLVTESEVLREREIAHGTLEESDRGWDDPLPLEDVTLVEAHPSYAEGRWGLDLHFVAPACYACSDGEWSSYTHSTTVISSLPASLAPFVGGATPWVTSYLRAHDGERLGGVAEVEVDEIAGLAGALRHPTP